MAQTAVWQLVAQSDFVSKLILLALFCLSVVCIAIIAFKWWYLRCQKKQLGKLRQRLRSTRTFPDLITVAKEFENSTGGSFLRTMLEECKGMMEHNQNSELSAVDLEYLELVLSQNLDLALMEEEKYLPILGTSAAVSPLVGLFGTVWGLVHAFISISQEKSADIAVVAPGIAEALITTLAGLIVAIPAMIFFHYFSNDIRIIEQKLIGVSDAFVSIVKKTFTK